MTPAELIALERLAEDALEEAKERAMHWAWVATDGDASFSAKKSYAAWQHYKELAAGTLRLIEDYRREERGIR